MPYDFEPYKPASAKDGYDFEPYEPEAAGPANKDALGFRDDVLKFADKAAPSVETLAGMVAGLPGQVAGGLHGLSTLVMQQGLDKANERMQKTMDVLSYKPLQKETPEMQAQLAETMAKPGQAAAEGARALGMDELGATNAQIATDVVMNLVDPVLAFKSAGTLGKRAPKLPKEEAPKSRVDSVMEGSKAKAYDFEPYTPGQGELFPEAGGVQADLGPQFDPSAPVSPARGQLSNARQMDLPVGEPGMPATMTATPDGILPVRPDAELFAHRDRAEQALVDRMDAENPQPPKNTQDMQQMLIDDTQHVLPDTNEVIAPQYGAMQGVGRMDENGMPIRADLSMEARNLENPLQRNLWGDELGPALGQDRSLTEAIDSLPQTPFRGDARDLALQALGRPEDVTLLHGGGPGSKDGQFRVSTMGNGFAVHDAAGKQIGRLESNMTPEQNAMLGYDPAFPASIDIVKVDPSVKGQGAGSAMYKAFFDAHKGNVMPSGKTTQDAWNVWKRSYPEKVDGFIDAEAKRIQDGAPASQVLSNITDPQIRTKVAEIAQGKNSAQMAAAYQPSAVPFNTRTRKQGGGILIPGRDKGKLTALKNIPGFSEPLRHVTPDLLPTEEFLAKFKDLPDVPQSVSQKAMNQLTKGGQYASIRMNDPYVKRATQRVRTAVNNMQAGIRDLIHADTGYAPSLRKLDKDEYIEVAQLLQRADRENVAIDLAKLREHGFSERAIDMVKTHQEYATKLEGPLQEAAKMAGISNVSMRNAYAASRLMGDYVAPIMKDGKKVGYITANTKLGLQNKLSRMKELPNSEGYVAAPVEFRGAGGGRRNPEGMGQLMQWLSDQNPEVAAFADVLTQINEQTAANYLNAKRHTKQKQGVFGMAGDDAFKSAYENAKDFWDSQVKYGESVIKWSEMSKAAEDVAPLYSSVDRPNANEYIKDYMANAMGRNPAKVGSLIDQMTASLGDAIGVGTTFPGKIVEGARKTTNVLLLAASSRFLLTNLVQPLRAMPEVASFLKSRGVDVRAFGVDSFMKGLIDTSGLSKKTPVLQGALDYAEKNHVYSSDLFESTNRTRKDVPFYLDKLQVPASKIEHITRKSVFLSTVDMLDKHGMTADQGLYQTAHNVTDMFMNNYNSSEAPLVYNQPGKAVGRSAANLMSYKHNELSRIAMHIEAAKDHKIFRPLMVSLMAQAAIGGLMGTITYKEADWVVEKLSHMMGKPTSLSKLLLENKDIPDFVKFGVPAVAGVDTSSAFGMDILPNMASPLDVLAPGASFLTKAAGSAVDAAKNPTEYNLKKAALDAAPIGPVKNVMEQQWFSAKNKKGETIAINPNTATASVKRTPGDELAKTLGFTGVHESAEKKLNWERSKIERFYEDKQKNALMDLRESLVSGNKADAARAREKYVNAQGDPESLEATLDQMAQDKLITAGDKILLKNQSDKINSVHTLKRNAK